MLASAELSSVAATTLSSEGFSQLKRTHPVAEARIPRDGRSSPIVGARGCIRLLTLLQRQQWLGIARPVNPLKLSRSADEFFVRNWRRLNGSLSTNLPTVTGV